MSKLKSNVGATLVELLITIVIGSLVTMAAITVLVFGLQAHKLGTDTTIRLNEVQMGIAAIRELIAEHTVAGIGEHGEILTPDGIGEEGEPKQKALLYHDDDANILYSAAGATVLDHVETYFAQWDNSNLITVTVTLENGKEYIIPVYCRIVELPPEETTTPSDENKEESPENGAAPYGLREDLSGEEILTEVLRDTTLQPSVRAFLSKLGSQLGSTGRILTETGDGDYYSQWYIGSYEENPGWNADTPWCACYVSWALEACSPFLEGTLARFANVDKFWVELVTTDAWKQENPQAGDLIFFDWIVDEEYNPQHVGVVLAQSNGWVYTIEGNANGVVAVRRYATEDAQILGYGILDWK